MDNIVLNKSIEFSLEIISLYKELKFDREFVLSSQLLRSGTSIGANISEAQYAQSSRDFISKMHIALKEANETLYWLELLSKSNYININQYEHLFEICLSIRRILSSIINSSKKKLNINNEIQ